MLGLNIFKQHYLVKDTPLHVYDSHAETLVTIEPSERRHVVITSIYGHSNNLIDETREELTDAEFLHLYGNYFDNERVK